LIGFQETKDESTKEVVFKMSSQISISFIKVNNKDFISVLYRVEDLIMNGV